MLKPLRYSRRSRPRAECGTRLRHLPQPDIVPAPPTPRESFTAVIASSIGRRGSRSDPHGPAPVKGCSVIPGGQAGFVGANLRCAKVAMYMPRAEPSTHRAECRWDMETRQKGAEAKCKCGLRGCRAPASIWGDDECSRRLACAPGRRDTAGKKLCVPSLPRARRFFPRGGMPRTGGGAGADDACGEARPSGRATTHAVAAGSLKLRPPGHTCACSRAAQGVFKM
jgi:hypothetical protein